MKALFEDIFFSVCGFFFVIYLCIVLAICKLLGVDLEEDFYD